MPLVTAWLTGLMAVPLSIALTYSGDPAGCLMLAGLVLGLFGIVGIVQLIKKLIWPEINYSIRTYRNHLIAGALSSLCCCMFFLHKNIWLALYPLLSIGITVYLYFLCRPESD
ncbi:MAG: hypothetical protein K2W88_05625 [Pararheinheimera sp.]|nr:hypothetical protein [Rheinheimera sp.]